MSDLDEQVRRRIASLSEKDLIKMLIAKPDEYLPEALAFARSEAQRRGINDISAVAVRRLDDEEARQARQTEPATAPEVPIRKARGLRAVFALFFVFLGFPIARFTALLFSPSSPAELAKYNTPLLFLFAFAFLYVGDAVFRRVVAPKRGQKGYRALAIAIMVIVFLCGSVANQIAKDIQSRGVGKAPPVSAARPTARAGVSLSLFGVQWLDSLQEVKQKHPKAERPPASLAGTAEMLWDVTPVFGLSAMVSYVFQDDALVQVVVTFTGDPTFDRFMVIQRQLDQHFGPMPSPVGATLVSLSSEKTEEDNLGAFRIHHRILTETPEPREQFTVFKLAR